jgi:hypothetical protein
MLVSLTDVADGALVSAIGAAGRWFVAAAPRGSDRDVELARWFSAYELTVVMPELPEMSPGLTERVADILNGEDVQAALQELLAVRLTDGADSYAEPARRTLFLTLTSTEPGCAPVAQALVDHYDDRICDLVGRLEGKDPALLPLIRGQAMSARMAMVLQAIERHAGALGTRTLATESAFLANYRRHVLEHYGKLEPPDFERRVRVPLDEIYVPTQIFEERHDPTNAPVPALTVYDLAERLDRTVLLGDPGGGKSTTACVLMHHFAHGSSGRIPFLVTLREFAASDPPDRSVVGHLEHQLTTLYQCPAPAGLVDYLLLSGRAVVIFDGLDELLDTTRRRDTTTRVEHFCAEYPLAPVLVTSRAVGYDQARLDESAFVSYRLSGFDDKRVAEYVGKWFAREPDARPGDSEAFLAESETVPDLRLNPLLLSLMCILYRGAGSLPRNRAEIYEACANLLYRKWDARRHIPHQLRANNLLDPTLRHLAWELLTREATQPTLTERELVDLAASFLHGRGFESADDARSAAAEFVEFCRGRMWVFSDAGTTARGEKLYAFTHRTFLEYFAAARLAYVSDTAEILADSLFDRDDWDVVSELAVQIKDRTSEDGARRIYQRLLTVPSRDVLMFLARALRSVDPSPGVVRVLTRAILGFLFANDPDSVAAGLPLAWLLTSCADCRDIVAHEVSDWIATMMASDDRATHLNGVRLAISLPSLLSIHGERGANMHPSDLLVRFWDDQLVTVLRAHTAAITAGAVSDPGIRIVALHAGLVTSAEVLRTPDGLRWLIGNPPIHMFGITWASYLGLRLDELIGASPDAAIEAFTEVGTYLASRGEPPWVTGGTDLLPMFNRIIPDQATTVQRPLTPVAYLGVAAALVIAAESDLAALLRFPPESLGPFSPLLSYAKHRTVSLQEPLPDLPVPAKFKRLFQDWATRRVNFTSPPP